MAHLLLLIDAPLFDASITNNAMFQTLNNINGQPIDIISRKEGIEFFGKEYPISSTILFTHVRIDEEAIPEFIVKHNIWVIYDKKTRFWKKQKVIGPHIEATLGSSVEDIGRCLHLAKWLKVPFIKNIVPIDKDSITYKKNKKDDWNYIYCFGYFKDQKVKGVEWK